MFLKLSLSGPTGTSPAHGSQFPESGQAPLDSVRDAVELLAFRSACMGSLPVRAVRSTIAVMMRPCWTRVLLLALAAAVAVSCARGPLDVSTIQLGRRLNSDNSVAEHTTAFGRNDTVYVSVLTTGPGSGEIGVRWTYAGVVISEPSRRVTYNGQAATEFHISNSGGFPPGNYLVEVFLDGAPIGERNFRVDP